MDPQFIKKKWKNDLSSIRRKQGFWLTIPSIFCLELSGRNFPLPNLSPMCSECSRSPCVFVVEAKPDDDNVVVWAWAVLVPGWVVEHPAGVLKLVVSCFGGDSHAFASMQQSPRWLRRWGPVRILSHLLQHWWDQRNATNKVTVGVSLLQTCFVCAHAALQVPPSCACLWTLSITRWTLSWSGSQALFAIACISS